MRLSFFQEVLLAAAAGLAVVLIVELSLLMPEHSRAESLVAAQSLQSLDPSGEEVLGLALPPRKSLRDFADRPLFERSRRAAGGSSTPKEDAGEIADITLVGTLITMTETVAILQTENARPVRARVGDIVGGWRVVQIKQDGVLLSNNQSEGWVSTGAQN